MRHQGFAPAEREAEEGGEGYIKESCHWVLGDYMFCVTYWSIWSVVEIAFEFIS